MLREVVAHEHVEKVSVAAQVRVGQCDQLTVAGGRSVSGGWGQEAEVPGHECSGHEEWCRCGVRGRFQDVGWPVGMAADEAVEQVGVVVGHTCTVDLGADDWLTVTDGLDVAPRGAALP